MSNIVSFGQGGPPGPETSPSDGEPIIHGCYSEDLRNIPGGGQICGLCGMRAHGSYARYLHLIQVYHNLDLSASGLENQFMVWFSNQAVPQSHEPLDVIGKILRLNRARREHAGE